MSLALWRIGSYFTSLADFFSNFLSSSVKKETQFKVLLLLLLSLLLLLLLLLLFCCCCCCFVAVAAAAAVQLSLIREFSIRHRNDRNDKVMLKDSFSFFQTT